MVDDESGIELSKIRYKLVVQSLLADTQLCTKHEKLWVATFSRHSRSKDFEVSGVGRNSISR